MRIIISRTDSIGDVVLTLPVAAALKEQLPDCTVIFLGRDYTLPVISLSKFIDETAVWKPEWSGEHVYGGVEMLKAMNADVILHVFPDKHICRAAKLARIPVRIATAGRIHTLLTCNRLLHITRKNSDLHEAQLNLKLLKGLKLRHEYSIKEIPEMYGLCAPLIQMRVFAEDHARIRVILHPKSKGSAREWGLENFSRLIGLLPRGQFDIAITGTVAEGAMMREFLDLHRDRVIDLTGKLTLDELMAAIAETDVLVAASTGPLHLAAALGTGTVGLYAPMRPIFPQRWAPLGKKATYLVLANGCNDCRKTGDCHCIRSIKPEEVVGSIARIVE
jgi:ADP-heptose:LPS heptosyltransferase